MRFCCSVISFFSAAFALSWASAGAAQSAAAASAATSGLIMLVLLLWVGVPGLPAPGL
jgi:hypothetical protein